MLSDIEIDEQFSFVDDVIADDDDDDDINPYEEIDIDDY